MNDLAIAASEESNYERVPPVNILFDLDGTLTNPREGILNCLRHALYKLGIPPPSYEILTENIGPPLEAIFQKLLPERDANTIQQAVNIYRECYMVSGMYENEVYPHIPEILAELKGRGARLYIATSKPASIARKVVDTFGLSKYFSAVFGADLAGELAAKPELVSHILSGESLKKAETAMVGDRKYDVLGARANGILPVGVLWGFGSREELAAAGADLICPQPPDLSALPETLRRNCG